MITKENLKELLIHLNFVEENNIFSKTIEKVDAILKIDFEKKEIIYPEKLIINDRRILNFSDNENFVVLECIHRLLEKGYKPEHLETEPKWKLGHEKKSGQGDILVKDHENNSLLLIECKTAGNEFSKEWKRMQSDGGQLFSYAQQIPTVQFLCLYASDFVDEKIRIDQKIISHQDNQKILEDNPKLESYQKAEDSYHRFQIWKKTYQLEFSQKGIFEENIQPYQIGKNKYTLEEDTKAIDVIDQNKKYEDFKIILRKHNIARRENAFEVLVNLFLCKIVDEQENKTDLQFYWKGIAYDNYFDFVDRLQNLYRRGMEKFLHETISYISNKDIENAFWAVKNNKNATKKQIQKYFRELKFFTNSAFSFLDTHNETKFNKNVKVLLEVVQMWQDIRLRTEEQNQFLGDTFEYFLDNSIKQSNGQFFTPLPICKFIVASLPLKEKIKQNQEPLKMIDFACGSGHFLNEYAHQIKEILIKENLKEKLKNYYENITGIEKEDRLAKVSKVASFMYGQEQIKILDIDALSQHEEIQKESYDILVANPPFSVDGFLQTLKEEDRKEFELTKIVGMDSGTDIIQCFFLETLVHLMTGGGIIGIVVPSTILSNNSKAEVKTREILIQYFDFISIVEFGNNTFGKTGTSTVVLFLRRKNNKPEDAEHYQNRVEDFFNGDTEQEQYQDEYFLQAYCNHIKIDFKIYKDLLNCKAIGNIKELLQCEIFQEYEKDFYQSTEIKNLKVKKTFKTKSKEEQQKELNQKFIHYLQEKEKKKIYIFILTYQQKILIINAPKESKKQDEFLGYKWVSGNKKEGIKYLNGNTVNDIITPLFNPQDLKDESKINVAIQKHFNGELTNSLPEYCKYANLCDMLDFQSVKFDKNISLNAEVINEIESKHDKTKLGELVENINGLWEGKKEPFQKVTVIRNTNFRKGGFLNLENVAVLEVEKKQYEKRKLLYGDIIVEKSGGSSTQAVGRVVFFDKKEGEYSYSNFTSRLRVINSKVKPKYLFIILNYIYDLGFTQPLQTGMSNIRNLDFKKYLDFKVPLPPLEIQQKIVSKCEAIDKEVEQANKEIENYQKEINEEIEKLSNKNYEKKRLEEFTEIKSGGTPLRKIKEYWENGIIPWLKSEVCKNKLVDEKVNHETITELGLNKSSAKYLEKDTTLIALVGATKGKVGFLKFKATTNQNIAGIKSNSKNLINYYIFIILKFSYKEIIKDLAQYDMLNLHHIKNLKIPLPPLNIQKKVIQKVEKLESKINDASKTIEESKGRKEKVLRSYL